MHKDLDDTSRKMIEANARNDAKVMHETGQSLAIAREAWLNEFDRTAAELDAA
jgi:hypothetical protein